MKYRYLFMLVVLLGGVVFFAGSCALRFAVPSAAIWTPVPVTAAPSRSWDALILPVSPRAGATGGAVSAASSATATRALATPTLSATPMPRFSPTPSATPTQDPHRVVITEADVLRAMPAGAGTQGGLALDGLGVRFTDGRLRLTANRLSYGPINVQDLVLVGRLVAQDGRLQLQTESIAPGGLAAAFIPTFANQALAQYAAQWYVEEVRTLDGRLELRIR